MPAETHVRAVQANFLHERLVWGLLSSEDEAKAQALIRQRVLAIGEPSAKIGVLENCVSRLLVSERCVALSSACSTSSVDPGALVVTRQRVEIRQADAQSGEFTGFLDASRETEIRGLFSTNWLTGTTAVRSIWGSHDFTILAFVEKDETRAERRDLTVRPVFIGWELDTPIDDQPTGDRREVFPDDIWQFRDVQSIRSVTESDLRRLGRMPEQAVKEAFAAIIGEHYIPRDWGGESSDLFTAQLTLSDTPVTAAFAFKGPGTRGQLFISNFGKRGDQALRLADEPADLLVIQHHREINPMVRRLIRALALERAKRFMVLDGQATARVLKAYGKLVTTTT